MSSSHAVTTVEEFGSHGPRTAGSHPSVSRKNPPSWGSDRGDVPGWVMLTVMTAIVVVALLGIFQGAVLDAVTNAFASISGMGG